jgi:hypothetical protein
MCRYTKDNGEQCGIETEPFCRHHDETDQAIEWKGEQYKQEASRDDFEGEAVQTLCDECESPVRTTVAALTEIDYNPKKVNTQMGLTCNCGDFVEIFRVSPKIEKYRLPNKWL